MGLVNPDVPENKAKALEIATLVATTSMLPLSGEEAIPYLVAFQPETASGLAFLEADEPNLDEEEAEELTKKSLQEVARTTTVQLASETPWKFISHRNLSCRFFGKGFDSSLSKRNKHSHFYRSSSARFFIKYAMPR